jgi:aquaporin Z
MYSPAFVEYLGTALLISAVAFATNPLWIPAVLGVAIALGGRISGGHFNPAVTAYQLFQGKISQNRALVYIIAQIAAALTVGVARNVL